MQQDQRFATCAHVAVWTLDYTAYRRGVSERRFIADVVEADARVHPLRPRASDGLSVREVTALLGDHGFRTTAYATPNLRSDASDLPRVTFGELPDDLKAVVAGLGAPNDEPGYDVTTLIVESLLDHVAGVTTTGDLDDGSPATVEPDHPTIRALHDLLDYLTAPYLRSGWPVYCGTTDHALVLCARARVDGRTVHFVHDDQSGPYLLVDSLPTASKLGLNYQSGHPVEMNSERPLDSPPPDRIAEELTAGRGIRRLVARDMGLALHSLVLAVPARVLLPAESANKVARTLGGILARSAAAAGEDTSLTSEDLGLLAQPLKTAVTIVTGIDYKRQRRANVLGSDPAAVTAFSVVQLAEWVTVVQGLARPAAGQDDVVVWEFVYDSSSSASAPRLQMARFLNTVVTTFPRDQEIPEVTRTMSHWLPPLGVPSRIAKVRHSGHHGDDTSARAGGRAAL